MASTLESNGDENLSKLSQHPPSSALACSFSHGQTYRSPTSSLTALILKKDSFGVVRKLVSLHTDENAPSSAEKAMSPSVKFTKKMYRKATEEVNGWIARELKAMGSQRGETNISLRNKVNKEATLSCQFCNKKFQYPSRLQKHVSNKDYLNGAKNDLNLGLLLAVSVLSTLLVVSLVAWLTWLCVKCCGPSCKRRNFRKHDSFPRHHRDLMGLPWVENSVNSSLGNRGYAPERTGISERLGYGRNSRLASVPYLPPPRSWTPSPPFPPEGLVPPKQRLIQPNPRNRLPRDGLQKVDEETNLEGNENQLSLGMGICQFCGSFQVCPVVLNKKMFYTQQHQPKTVNSELRSAEIRPGGSTSMKSFRSQPIIEKKIYFKEDVAECEEGKKEECYELCNVVKRRENKSWTARHPQKLITTNPKNSWRVFQSDQTGPFPDLQKLDKLIYHTRNKNDVGVDEKEFKELDGRRINPGCCEPQKVMTSGSVPVIIESPSSLSLLDMYQNGLKSQKEPRMYWKLYNDENPQAVSSPTRATCRAADMKDDFYDMVPSMSWDHLNPDLSTVLDPSGRPSTWGNVVVDVGAQKASFHASRKTETGAQDPEISRTEI